MLHSQELSFNRNVRVAAHASRGSNGRHEQHRNWCDFRARRRPTINFLARTARRGQWHSQCAHRRPSSSRVSWPAPPGRCWASDVKKNKRRAGSSSARRATPSPSHEGKDQDRTSTRRTGGEGEASSPRATFDEGARAQATPRRSSSRARARTRRRGARSGAAPRHDR